MTNSIPHPLQQPLWRLLQATAQVVQEVRRGSSGNTAIAAVHVTLRPGVQALAFQVWRNLGRAEALRKVLAPRKPSAAVDALLCTVLALVWDPVSAPYDAFTLVNQTVDAAKKQVGTRPQASFLNACLRRFLRERSALVTQTNADPVALWNHPAWWIGQVQTAYPDRWQGILAAANRHPPMALRVNVRRSAAKEYLAVLKNAGVGAQMQAGGAVLLDAPMPVAHIPGFLDGVVSVQDAAAQMAAPLLLGDWKGAPPTSVLDACAAPGGKTGHLLELCEAQVLALEIDSQRCERITENLSRLGLQARVQVADAGKPASWWNGEMFDAVLLDAPCSASGIVRRHPDIRWLRRESDIAALVAVQRELLQNLWALVKPGGRLLYCTCSLFPEEGVQQVQTFLTHNTDARLLPSPGHLLPQNGANTGDLPDNQAGDYDAFYFALLEKRQV
jgi:16S rRNA (cytosine967-C5)-methyltransferase